MSPTKDEQLLNVEELTPKQIYEYYMKGMLSNYDICYAWEIGKLGTNEVADLLKMNPLKVANYCRKVLGDVVNQMAKEEANSVDLSAATGGGLARGRGRGGPAGVMSPTLEVLTQLASLAASQAVTDAQFWMELGREVYNIAYFYAARDPRYSEALKTDPRTTVARFIEDAMATYIGLAEVFNRIRSIIYRLINIIEQYDAILRRIAPRLYPSFIAELETKAMITLLDRIILARILGVKLGAIPKFVRLWFEYEGEKFVQQQLAQIFGVPPEYLEHAG